MRKALIALLMGATIATPLAAQERGRGGREGWTQTARGNSSSRTARTQSRSESPRAERSERPQVSRPQRPATQRTERPAVAQRGERAGRPQPNRTPNVRTERPNRPGTEQRVNRDLNGARNWPGQAERTRQVLSRAENRGERRDDRWDRRDDRRGDRADRRDDRRDWRNDRRGNVRWDRNWRNDNRYDWQRYRQANRNIYRLGRYYAPYRNYSYSRLSIGLFLGSAFYSDRYWLNDPWQYRLPPAYAGTRWVRYYDDALLVDVYTGEVVDVIYDFFW